MNSQLFCSKNQTGTITVQYRFLRLCSHGNDIVPSLYWSDFWNGKVDCSHGSGPLSYQFWDLFTRVWYHIVPKHLAPKQAKENLICQQIRVISI